MVASCDKANKEMKTEKEVKKLLVNYKILHKEYLNKFKTQNDLDLQSVFLEECKRLTIKIKLLKSILK